MPPPDPESMLSTGHLRSSLKGRALRGSLLVLAAQLLRQVITLGSLLVLARLLSPGDFGLMAMVLGVTGLLDIVKTLGLSEATIRERELSAVQVNSLFWVNLGFGALLGLVCLAIGPLMAAFYREPRVAPMFVLVALVFLLSSAGVQHRALLRRSMRFGPMIAADLAACVTHAATAVGAAWAGWGYWSLACALVASELTLCLGAWLASGWRPGAPHLDATSGRLIRFGLHLQLANLGVVVMKLDSLLIGRLWGAQELGQYNRAFNLLIVPLYQVMEAFRLVQSSALSLLQDDPVKLRVHYLDTVALMAGLTLPAMAFCLVMSDAIVAVVLGPQWAPCAPILAVLALTVPVMPLLESTKWLNAALGRSRNVMLASFAGALLGGLGIAIGVNFGALGVAWGLAAFCSLSAVPMTAYLLRGTPVSMTQLAAALWRPVLVTLCVGAALLGLRLGVPFTGPGGLLLAGVATAGTATLLCGSWLAGHANPVTWMRGWKHLLRRPR